MQEEFVELQSIAGLCDIIVQGGYRKKRQTEEEEKKKNIELAVCKVIYDKITKNRIFFPPTMTIFEERRRKEELTCIRCNDNESRGALTSTNQCVISIDGDKLFTPEHDTLLEE